MKSIEAYKAYCALEKLMNCGSIPFWLRVELVNLKKLMEPVATAYEQAETDIVNRYGDRDENGEVKIQNGKVAVTDQANLAQALKEMNALKAEPVKLVLPPLEVKTAECEKADITASDIEALLPVMHFMKN